jgi:hypothetical protein
MKVLAISIKGKEYLYNARTAHKANAKKIEQIRDALNRQGWKLKTGETWFIHDINQYDTAFEYAQFQSFKAGKRGLFETGAQW